jgi:hypothetical protein
MFFTFFTQEPSTFDGSFALDGRLSGLHRVYERKGVVYVFRPHAFSWCATKKNPRGLSAPGDSDKVIKSLEFHRLRA